MHLVNAALTFAEYGLSVFPAKPKEKRPLLPSWAEYQNRCANEEELVGWWEDTPDANIAVICGKVSGGLVIIDVDGPENKWPFGKELPVCPISLTGGGGKQYWFKEPKGAVIQCSTSKLAPKVDVKAEGGYVIAPPSIHPSGTPYAWASEDFELNCAVSELPELPDWIFKALTAKPRVHEEQSTEGFAPLLKGVGKGERNATAAKLAGHLLAANHNRAEVEQILSLWNEKNDPPLPDRELMQVITSIARRQLLKEGNHPAPGELVQDISDEDRIGILKEISDQIKVRIEDVVRIGGDSPYYEFIINGKKARVLAADLATPRIFSQAVIEAAEKVPRLPTKTSKNVKPWYRIADMLMAIAKHKEPSEEATLSGQIKMWTISFLRIYPPRKDREISAPTESYESAKGETFIDREVFQRHVNTRYGEHVSSRKFTQHLTSEGFVRHRLWAMMDSGKRERFWHYKVPPRIINTDDFLPNECHSCGATINPDECDKCVKCGNNICKLCIVMADDTVLCEVCAEEEDSGEDKKNNGELFK